MNLLPPRHSEEGEPTHSMSADLPRKSHVPDGTEQSPVFPRNCSNNRLQLSAAETNLDIPALNILSTLNEVVRVDSEIV